MAVSTATLRRPRLPLALAALAVLPLLAACGSSNPKAAPVTGLGAKGMFDQRYCEVLVVAPAKAPASGLLATVWNTYGQNDCPEAAWSEIDAMAEAKSRGGIAGVRNGPRYWLIDEVVKPHEGKLPRSTFGSLAMTADATVPVSVDDLRSSRSSYVAHSVHRTTTFTWPAGHDRFVLVDPSGRRWVMQSYSTQVDPTLTLEGLADLGARLKPPAGWTYRVEPGGKALVVATVNEDAHVMQDELMNAYTQIPVPAG